MGFNSGFKGLNVLVFRVKKYCSTNYEYSGGLEVACWPLVPKFADSHPAEAVGFLERKISSEGK